MAAPRPTSVHVLTRISESPCQTGVVEAASPDAADAAVPTTAHENEILELTSSDDDECIPKDVKPIVVKQEAMELSSSGPEDVPVQKPIKAASKKRTYRSRRMDTTSTARLQEVDPPKDPSPRKTRSASGITRKRVLKDAGLVSDNEELPATISPTKRPRGSGSKAAELAARAELAAVQAELAVASAELAAAKARLTAASAADSWGDVKPAVTAPLVGSHVPPDTVEGGLLPAAEIDVSLSPLKLGVGKVSVAMPVDDENPFLTAPVSSVDKGKRRATYDPFLDLEVAAKHFADEADEALRIEDEFIAAAIDASRALAEHPGAGSSSSIVPVTSIDTVDMDTTVSATANLAAAPFTPGKRPAGLYTPAVSGPHSGPQFSLNVARKTFKDVIAPTRITPMLGNGPVLDDYMSFRVSALPDVCGAFFPDAQDPFLAADYPTLPHLRFGILKGWGDSDIVNSVWFSGWADQCPNMDFLTALAAIRFVRRGNMINGSRVSPLDVYITFITHEKRRSILNCNGKPAICLTPILSKDCFLYEPTTIGLKNKYISGHLHQQEYQRFASFACTVFDKKSMVAQLKGGALSFTTMGNAKGDKESFSPSKPPRNPNILADVITPGIKQKPVKNNTFFKTVLNYTDDIPVYDARHHPFNFDSDLDDIASHLPLLGEEIPCNSFVVVGHTMGHYEKDGRAHLTTNILFAILVGSEFDD